MSQVAEAYASSTSLEVFTHKQKLKRETGFTAICGMRKEGCFQNEFANGVAQRSMPLAAKQNRKFIPTISRGINFSGPGSNRAKTIFTNSRSTALWRPLDWRCLKTDDFSEPSSDVADVPVQFTNWVEFRIADVAVALP